MLDMNHIMFAIFRKFRSKQLDCLRFLEINQSADTSTKKQTNKQLQRQEY